MLLNDDDTEYLKTKTSENFNPKIFQKQIQFSNDLSDPEENNDLIKFTDMININTLGSQPIIMYKKTEKLYSPKQEKRESKKPIAKSMEKILIDNFIKKNIIVDGGLNQKMNKYKTKPINVHSQSPINKSKTKYKPKTNRNSENAKKRPKTQKASVKNKEFIPKTAKTNLRQKNNINNNINLKREKTNPNLKTNNKNIINNSNLNNYKKQKKKEKKPNNNLIGNNNNNKYKSDKNSIEDEETQEKKKNDYMNDLIRNGIVGFAKELEAKKKKISENKKNAERKLDYLLENGINQNGEDEFENGIVVMGKSKDKNLFKIKKIKPKKKIKIEKINTNNINNIDINYHTENDKFIYNNLTSSNNNILTSELSKNLTKNKNVSSNNNIYSEVEINMNKMNIEQELKRKICKPKISQFEFLEKIRINFKKIRNQKQKNSPELINNNSFKYSQLNKLKNKLVNKKSNNNINLKQDKNFKEIDNIQKNDEFLYADKISHRTKTELEKFKKKKKIEKKKEQNEEMQKKQDKILNTLQNLIKLGEECKYNNTNNSPIKIRNDSKNHVKKRKIVNEYYVGTEESKNNTSTFIDKQEYYKSIIESKNVLNYSKVEKTETNVEDINYNTNINNNYRINNNENNFRKLSSEYNYDVINTKNNNNNKALDNKLSDLRAKVLNTMKRSNELFNKENIKRIKSDLYDNNSIIKSKFENKFFNKNLFKNYNNNNHYNNNIESKEEKFDKNMKKKIIEFQNIFKSFMLKRFWNNLKGKYNEIKLKQEKIKKKTGIELLVGICKIYQFKKIQAYNEKMKWSLAIKSLIIPFIRQEFTNFVIKMRNIKKFNIFKSIISHFFKYKILQKLLKYCAVVDFWKNIIIPGGIRLQHFILKNCFKKIKDYGKSISSDMNYNVNRNVVSRSYLNSHFLNEEKKANSYIYESLDCADSISVHPNSVDNDGLHQLKEIIEMQNENRLEDSSLDNGINEESGRIYGVRTNSNNSINTLDSINNQLVGNDENSSINENSNENLIKTEFHIKETLLKKIINNNDTVDEKSKNGNNKKDEDIKKEEEKNDPIFTKINEEKEKDKNEKINRIPLKEEVIKNLDNYIKNSQSDNSASEIISNVQNISNKESNKENKDSIEDLKELINKIPNKEKFAKELTEQIISKLLSEQGIINSSAQLFPKKTNNFDYKKYSLIDQSLLTNNNLSELSNTFESLTSSFTDSNQLLEKSMIFQYSISSEFNKTIKEKKNKLETNLYNEYIIEKLILLILKEIKKNYARIYDNISVPYKANYEEIIVASFLQDNDLLNEGYKELKVKEDLKSIINKKEILAKFDSINKKIRLKKGLEENNSYDNLINECIIDATIEILNKERAYGQQGEPFPFSKRGKELCYKYTRDDPKPLMKHVYKEIKRILFGKGNIIKENSPIFDKNDPFLMNIFKKEMEGEDIWSDLEIQEEQVKSIASSIIFEQLINEVIEILEHVQLNRKRPELYQDKSIYACDDIPRLSFQMISTNTENDND